MSIRKRKWATRQGEQKEAWVVDYVDQGGKRHLQTFERKKDADDYHANVKVEVGRGTHTAPSRSITVAQAAEDWIAFVKLEGRERSTVEQYRQHVTHHIAPRLGQERLARLTAPRVNAFLRDLRAHTSRAMAGKVLKSLKAILRHAQIEGNVAQNVALGVKLGADKRSKRRLEAGVDIPTPEEVGRIIRAATGRWRPLILTAIFTGLRASELRGLRWEDIDLKRSSLRVRQRADRYNVIGRPKSESGIREVPLPPLVLSALREWKLACPQGGLVFPNTKGRIQSRASIAALGLGPALVAAGVTGEDGKPKYALHALRHFYASWCINRRVDGGLELPLKLVQARLGHSTIGMTADTYGHLFPSSDDGVELAAAERVLWDAT
jgi:integrase